MEQVVRHRDRLTPPANVSSAYYPVGTRVWVVSWNTHQVRRCRIARRVTRATWPSRHRRTKRVIEAGYEDQNGSVALERSYEGPARALPCYCVED